MGHFDQLILQTVTNHVSAGTGTVQLTVYIEHSADGVHWISKSTSPAIDTPLNASGPTYPPLAIDDGSTPSLGLVRLSITLSAFSGPVRARVRITVTGNDLREKEFARQAEHFKDSYNFSDYYYLCYTSDQYLTSADFNIGQLQAAIQEGAIPLDILFQPTQMWKGVTCCFRENRDFILVKNGVVIYASDPPVTSGAYPASDHPGYEPPKSPEGPPVEVKPTWQLVRHVND